MEHSITMVLTVLRGDAREIRVILRVHSRNGAQFTERRRWFFWVRFTIVGPSTALAAVQLDLDAIEGEKAIQDAW